MASVSISDLKKFISKILKGADLTKLSSKMIRNRCEERFQTDLTSRKQEVDRIVMSFISKGHDDHHESNSDQEGSDSDDSNGKSGTSESESSAKSDSDGKSSDSENGRFESPPKAKKPKKIENSCANDKPVAAKLNNSNQMKSKSVAKEKKKSVAGMAEHTLDSRDDAALARQLQEEEWNFRSRSSRRGGSKKLEVKHKKGANKGERKTRKGSSTYTRKCVLSPELAEIMESNEMARPDVVKKMWSIVRERDLFDPSNKQFAFCDEQLRKVFGAKRIRMFSMMKYLKNHMKDLK